MYKRQGVPLVVDAKLYNVAAALCRGEILGLTTKTFLPNYGEFYEMRQFTAGPDVPGEILFNGKKVPFRAAKLGIFTKSSENTSRNTS